MLDVPVALLRYLSRLLRAERRRRATPTGSRKLTCRDQALLTLRWFRDRTRIEAPGRDHGVSRATAYRYVAEAVDVLCAQAPDLAEGLERAMADGVPYVILDGKVFASDRCSESATSVKGEQIDAWYPGKAHRHGGNVQAVMRPDGLPLWAGPAEPGSVVDLTYPVFTTAFGGVLKFEGLRIITTLPKTPRMNAVCERVNGTLRRELLDRILIPSSNHVTQYSSGTPLVPEAPRPPRHLPPISACLPACPAESPLPGSRY
jgi:hypothetical protein